MLILFWVTVLLLGVLTFVIVGLIPRTAASVFLVILLFKSDWAEIPPGILMFLSVAATLIVGYIFDIKDFKNENTMTHKVLAKVLGYISPPI